MGKKIKGMDRGSRAWEGKGEWSKRKRRKRCSDIWVKEETRRRRKRDISLVRRVMLKAGWKYEVLQRRR